MLDVTTAYDHQTEDELEAAAHHAMVETPSVAFASGFFAPLAMMQESQMFMRRSAALSRRWAESLLQCRSAPEMIETNARFGEKALAMGFSECWRIAERSALMGRRAVARRSLELRDARLD